MTRHVWGSPDPEEMEDVMLGSAMICRRMKPYSTGYIAMVTVFHPSMVIDRFDYICEVCGERTHRNAEYDAVILQDTARAAGVDWPRMTPGQVWAIVRTAPRVAGPWQRGGSYPWYRDDAFGEPVAGGPYIVRGGELPAAWGLLVLEDGKLVTRVEAPLLEAAPWTRGFFASLLRSATQHTVHRSAVAELAEKRAEELARYRRSAKENDYDRVERAHAALHEAVEAFEKASGIKVHNPYPYPRVLGDPAAVGAAVKHLLTHGLDVDGMAGVRNLLQASLRELDGAMELAAKLPKVAPTPAAEAPPARPRARRGGTP